jgi:hypothetical protein
MKLSRKEYLEVMFGVGFLLALVIMYSPFLYLYHKWDTFWNKKVIEVKA